MAGYKKFSYLQKSVLFSQNHFFFTKSASTKPISLNSYTAPNWRIQKRVGDGGGGGLAQVIRSPDQWSEGYKLEQQNLPACFVCLSVCLSVISLSLKAWLVRTQTNWTIQKKLVVSALEQSDLGLFYLNIGLLSWYPTVLCLHYLQWSLQYLAIFGKE